MGPVELPATLSNEQRHAVESALTTLAEEYTRRAASHTERGKAMSEAAAGAAYTPAGVQEVVGKIGIEVGQSLAYDDAATELLRFAAHITARAA